MAPTSLQPPINPERWLLIARKDGSSASRRSRTFKDKEAFKRALRKWQKEGFNTWWIKRPGGILVPIDDITILIWNELDSSGETPGQRRAKSL
jgi:hypothetical protein